MEAEQKDPASTLAFVRSLVWLRAREPTLQSGAQFLVNAGPDVLGFERRGDQRFLVALNFSSHEVRLGLGVEPTGPAETLALMELSTDPLRDRGRVGVGNLVLGPDEGVILRLR